MARPNLELTSSEKAALLAYREHFKRHGVPPSYRALADTLELAVNSAWYIVQSLRKKGYLEERPITQMRLLPTDKARKVSA